MYIHIKPSTALINGWPDTTRHTSNGKIRTQSNQVNEQSCFDGISSIFPICLLLSTSWWASAAPSNGRYLKITDKCLSYYVQCSCLVLGETFLAATVTVTVTVTVREDGGDGVHNPHHDSHLHLASLWDRTATNPPAYSLTVDVVHRLGFWRSNRNLFVWSFGCSLKASLRWIYIGSQFIFIYFVKLPLSPCEGRIFLHDKGVFGFLGQIWDSTEGTR